MAVADSASATDILVMGVDGPERRVLERLARDLQMTLGRSAAVATWELSPQFARDASRGQFNSSLILAELFGREVRFPRRILGVTGVDLFAPVLTFVFGEAQMHGPAAIVSTFRLRPELYGLPPSEDLVARRLLVESAHELGHTAGLIHCQNQGCAMIGSTYAEEIDLKGPGFCDVCQRVFARSWVKNNGWSTHGVAHGDPEQI